MLRTAALIAHCESFSLASLRSRLAFISEGDSAPRAFPFCSSQGPVRKKQLGRGFEQLVTSELKSAQCPHASPSQREHSPVLFTQLDQRPSTAGSDMISFGVSDNDLDDSFSLAASDVEELSGSVTDPALLPSSASRSARLRVDEKLIHVMKGYEHLPPLDESVAANLCPPMAIGWTGSTSALAGRAYSAAGQAASALHSMVVLQVFQAKMLASEDAGLDSASLRDMRSATDLALRATKATAQAIGHSMSSLIVLERHLCLTMTEMKEADKIPFLDAPVSSGSLFGPAVEGFTECFTEAQKSSQAMRHFLPKHSSSSSASICPKSVPTQQTAKPAPTTPEP